MPQLQITEPNLQEFVLPSTEGLPDDQQAKVVMDVSPYRTADLSGIASTMSQGEAGIALLTTHIKEWNYTDENGARVPINAATVGHLDINDFNFLQNKIVNITSVTPEEKKTSSEPLEPPQTPAQPGKIPVHEQ